MASGIKLFYATLKSLFFVFIFLYLCIALYVGTFVNDNHIWLSDTIIVLGAKSYVNGEYNPCLVSRVDRAAELYQKDYSKNIILSGGTDTEDGINEAETMREIAIAKDLPAGALFLEKESTSTYENIINSQKIMAKNNMKIALLVTEPFHIARAVLVARTVKIPSYYSSSVDSPCWEKWQYFSRYFLKEPVGIMWYVITGKIDPGAFFD